ncbi:hypothetical protein SAMN04488100_10928 [Alkalibacterium putridalgicola]|uniref:DUF4352 domain-containing protein n=1 Tax=Alkalibacterium putridalgicola TaxID=426703 RepID=A0A1H7SRW1_9LACT|nr:hypothetical protein [Alkalibacterium putridalgicola]GEK89182.1 hypothetical protein APU01nite_12210 [Alkalibacterium putridalgicola]SEL74634.1 hypothetical protein SAMN04488100_10928 [Alkalibacterium putridalgicola]
MNWKKVLMLSSVSLLMGACSSRETQDSSPVDEVVEDVAEDTESAIDTEEVDAEEVVEEEDTESADNVGKRSNPIPLGQSVVYTETYYGDDFETEYEAVYEMTITDVIRGEEAFTILQEENQFNEPAPEGMEWAIITIKGMLHEGDEDVPYSVSPWFSIIDSSGSEVTQDDYASLNGNEYGYVDLFPGGETEGRITMYMPVEDESLLVLDDVFGTGIFFSLSE